MARPEIGHYELVFEWKSVSGYVLVTYSYVDIFQIFVEIFFRVFDTIRVGVH